MRTIKLIFIIPCLLFVFSACQKDNYQAPNATISGALTDAEIGGPLSLSQNGSGGSVRMLVNDPAKYPAPSQLDFVLKQDGTYFNSQVFSENYKIFPLLQSGPWQYTKSTVPAWAAAAVPAPNPLTLAGDTLNINVPAGGNTVTNFKVYPYFRITITAVDTNITVNITQSLAAIANGNQLTNSNNLLICVNNYPLVNSSISSNGPGKYYVNQWPFSINSTPGNTSVWSGTSTTQAYTFGTTLALPVKDYLKSDGTSNVYGIRWALTHWPKGTYYWRASILGAGSSGQSNWSNTVTTVIH